MVFQVFLPFRLKPFESETKTFAPHQQFKGLRGGVTRLDGARGKKQVWLPNNQT